MKKKKIKLSITLPTKWSELTAEQVSRVAIYLNSRENNLEKLIALASDLAGLHIRGTVIDENGEIAYKFYRRGTGNMLLDSDQIALLTKTLAWISGEISLMQAPLLDGCQTPDYRLYGITLEQFLTAESAYSHFVTTESAEALRVCAAALYPRAEYSSDTVAREAQRLARFDSKLYGVFLWFTSAKKFLAEKYPYLYGQSEYDGESPKGADMLLSMLSSLNNGDPTKNDTLKATELHEALHELNLKIKNSKRDV